MSKLCQKGHEVVGDNLRWLTYKTTAGTRLKKPECRECYNARARKSYANTRRGGQPVKSQQQIHLNEMKLTHRILSLEDEMFAAPAWRRLEIQDEITQLAEAKR